MLLFRLIRESPCGNDCSNGCNGKFTEDQRIRVYDIYWALASGSEVYLLKFSDHFYGKILLILNNIKVTEKVDQLTCFVSI